MIFISSDTIKGEWWYGPTGIGKSKTAWDLHPTAYPKSSKTKWWDGYQGQAVVIMDDLTVESVKHLWEHLMKWCDHHPTILENKGGALPNNFLKFIVTSNYSLDEVIEVVPPESREAFLRRFPIIKQFT